jgi:hypothetical protein
MGRACSTNGEKRNAYRILIGRPKGKRPQEDKDVGGWTILKWILIGWDGMDWIDLAQDRDHWRALVNTVMTFGFHKMLGSS